MLSIILRIALSTRKQSAMLAASVKSSFSVGGLMKATCAAPIFTHHVSICLVSWNRYACRISSYQRDDVGQRCEQN